MQKTKILLLVICIHFTSHIWCQNLSLKVTSQSNLKEHVIDSLDYLKTHKDYNSLISEIDTIQKKLYKIGYFENLYETTKINDSTYQAKFQLKKKYRYIHIYYDKNLVAPSILNYVSKQVNDSFFILPVNKIESALHIINSKLAENGYPFSKLHLTNIRSDNETNLKADLVINDTTEKRVISAIKIKGYEKFPESFLRYYLKIKPNQPFNLSLIKSKTEQLNNLRFANQIKTPEVLFTKDSTNLYMYIEKSKSNTFDGFLGFGTNEATNKIDLNGYLNLNLTNNLNYGESFSLLYKSTQNQQKKFEVNVTLPYLLKTPIGVEFQLHIFKQDSTFTTVNQAAKLHYQINTQYNIFTGIKTTESNNLLNLNTTANFEDYKSNFITFGYEFTKPQVHSLLFPINSDILIETGFGQRKHLDTTEKQTLISFDAFKIINLNRKNSIYTRLVGANLISNTYFENELSRFGGINSIRGFNENSLLATSYALINSEYRLQLSNTIYIHSIIDVGYLENKITKTNKKLTGFGFGFGILSNAGLFKLNYANGRSQGQVFKFSNSQVHLSLISNF
ncbi:POTRA domain-containing protein [Yeosuana marina]|uniref:POTRA domain-containing protein n=1 Tax=Yeosuana marina TaxID=1565536 RepID=UPI0030C7CD53